MFRGFPGWALVGLVGAGCAPEPLPEPLDPEIQARADHLYSQAGETFARFEASLLLNQVRHRHEDPEAFLDSLALEPGQVVADIGCGVGYYTFDLARAVGPEGRVIAVDLQKAAVAFLRQRAGREAMNPWDNVQVRVNRPHHVGIDPRTVDHAVMAHLDFPLNETLLPENRAFLESVFQALRPGGQLTVLQFVAPGREIEPLAGHFTDAGFTRVWERFDPDEQTGWFRFVRPSPEDPEAPVDPEEERQEGGGSGLGTGDRP